MPRSARIAATLIAAFLLSLVVAGPAAAHDERPAVYPDGTYHVPAYRTGGRELLVCKTDRADFTRRVRAFPAALKTRNLELWNRCQSEGFRDLQAAVDAVPGPETTIRILPGIYYEEPTSGPPTGPCADLKALRVSAHYGYQVLSFEQQQACPNNQQLVAVLNTTDLQIEGTGATNSDVVLDARFSKLNAVRVDRSKGFYIRNLTIQRTTFNALYIMETDGFVIDDVVGRWNDEYGFLTFADDHGLYKNCEAYGNGDSGVYPGAAVNLNEDRGFDVPRYAVEITGCYSHDNALGYSGTAGDSVWAHDNRFVHNGAGISTDSAFPDHPGLPQNHAKFEHNDIGDNNQDYYRYVADGTCARPSAQRGYERGVVCPAVGLPTGTGILNPGGNYNIWQDNWIYGHNYAGVLTTWVPGLIRDDDSWSAQWDTSHHDRYLRNQLGVSPAGERRPNRLDYWWDGQGTDNCWTPASSPTEPVAMPACGSGWQGAALGGPVRWAGEPMKILKLVTCNGFDLETARIPGNCDWFGARGFERIEVQVAAGGAVVVGAVLLVLWWRRLRRGGGPLGMAGLALALAGLAVGVYGAAHEGTRWTAAGLLLLGLGWLASGLALRRVGRTRLGAAGMVLGVIVLLGALDRGWWMLPYLPLSPAWCQLLLETVVVPWALTVALLHREAQGQQHGQQ